MSFRPSNRLKCFHGNWKQAQITRHREKVLFFYDRTMYKCGLFTFVQWHALNDLLLLQKASIPLNHWIKTIDQNYLNSKLIKIIIESLMCKFSAYFWSPFRDKLVSVAQEGSMSAFDLWLCNWLHFKPDQSWWWFLKNEGKISSILSVR